MTIQVTTPLRRRYSLTSSISGAILSRDTEKMRSERERKFVEVEGVVTHHGPAVSAPLRRPTRQSVFATLTGVVPPHFCARNIHRETG
jgi:hypothetical protein